MKIKGRGGRSVALLLAAAYGLLIVYGSLYPVSGPAEGDANAPLRFYWPEHVSRSDFVINVLVYMPFGLFLCRGLSRRFPLPSSIAVSTLAGMLLSSLLEFLQGFVPGRIPSLVDLVTNTAGTMTGALTASFAAPETVVGKKVADIRSAWFLRDNLTLVGLSVPVLWALSELSPLVPSADLGNLRHGLSRLWHTVADFSLFDVQEAVFYALTVTGLALVTATLLRPGRSPLRPVIVFTMSVLALKVPVIRQQISLEGLAGAVSGFAIFSVLTRFNRMAGAWLAFVSLLAAYVVDGLHAGSVSAGTGDTPHSTMNLVPFRAHMENIDGLADIVFGAWPFLGMGYLAAKLLEHRSKKAVVTMGGAFVAMLTLAVEWAQQHIPGRTSDITDVFIAVAAWSIPFFIKTEHPATERGVAISSVASPSRADSGLVTTGKGLVRMVLPLVLGLMALTLTIKTVLHLPDIPYNVRELFLAEGSVFRVALFSAALLWVGMSGAFIGLRLAKKRLPVFSLASAVFASGMVSLFLLKISVTGESIDDIVGSSNVHWFVMNKDMWGTFGVRLFTFIDSPGLIGAVERVVRYLALYSPLIFCLAVFTAVFVKGSVTKGLTTFFSWSLAALPWFFLCKVIAFDYSSTDNLNELIARDGEYGIGGGGYLYLLLILVTGSASFLACSAGRGFSRCAKAAVICVAALPAGWWFIRNGLVTDFAKYGTPYSGVDFLLGPDRETHLSSSVLFLRWCGVQLGAVLILAYGQAIMLMMRRKSRQEERGPAAHHGDIPDEPASSDTARLSLERDR